jgi:hypothetical protein
MMKVDVWFDQHHKKKLPLGREQGVVKEREGKCMKKSYRQVSDFRDKP